MNFYKGESFEGWAVENRGAVESVIPLGGNFVRDWFSSIRDFFGGKVGSTKYLIEQAIEQAKVELEAKAAERGGNGVVNYSVDFEFGGKGNGIVCVLVTGDAARITRRPVA